MTRADIEKLINIALAEVHHEMWASAADKFVDIAKFCRERQTADHPQLQMYKAGIPKNPDEQATVVSRSGNNQVIKTPAEQYEAHRKISRTSDLGIGDAPRLCDGGWFVMAPDTEKGKNLYVLSGPWDCELAASAAARGDFSRAHILEAQEARK